MRGPEQPEAVGTPHNHPHGGHRSPNLDDDGASTDLDLVRRARHGDDRAFHLLVDRHAAELYGFARGLAGNAADAEDLLQETFAGAFRGLSRFEGRATVRTWLNGILTRQAARLHRTRWRRPVVSLEPGAGEGAGRPAPPPPEIHLDVMGAIDRLEPEHRQVIVLRELRGLSYREMAEALGVPVGTVESRLHRARETLRGRLEGYLER